VTKVATRSYVAIGDSLSEGLGDERFESDRMFAGWSDRLAAILNEEARVDGHEFSYANLAIRSRNVREIMTTQVELARRLNPDLVTVMAGANDLWRSGVRWSEIEAIYRKGLVRLQSGGSRVVVANCINPVHLWAFRSGVGRAAQMTELIEDLAGEMNLPVLDVYRSHTLARLRVWSDDLVHFGARGHAHVANRAAELLELEHRVAPPKLGRDSRDYLTPPEYVSWITSHVVPFFHRRLQGAAAGDGIMAKRPLLSSVDDHPWPVVRASERQVPRLRAASTPRPQASQLVSS
jgi:lysophospholipase L1-like esterase